MSLSDSKTDSRTVPADATTAVPITGIELIREEINHILSYNVEDINRYMDHYGREGIYHIKGSEEVEDLLESVHSSAFWDDILTTTSINHKQQTEDIIHVIDPEYITETDKRKLEIGVEVIAECADAMEKLSTSLHQPIEILHSNVLQSMPELAIDENTMNTYFHHTDDFVKSDSFWNEVVHMQVEVSEYIHIIFSLCKC